MNGVQSRTGKKLKVVRLESTMNIKLAATVLNWIKTSVMRPVRVRGPPGYRPVCKEPNCDDCSNATSCQEGSDQGGGQSRAPTRRMPTTSSSSVADVRPTRLALPQRAKQ